MENVKKRDGCLFSVLDYGIDGAGGANAAGAIQEAIDSASAAGGGTVYFPPGRYVSGSIRLASNVKLYLEAGAVLAGSESFSDYQEMGGGRYFFIGGRGCENSGIAGRGTIHGQGEKFWKTDEGLSENYAPHGRYAPVESRPFAMVHFRDSRNVFIEDITMVDSACYAVWLLGCDGAKIRGINIRNSHYGPNTDGLDIDCSSNVAISDCDIDSGDDCIALKSDTKALGRIKACENITVTNCQLSSSTCAVRVGWEGDGPIRNCVFSNLAVHDCRSGLTIDVISGVDRKRIKIEKGPCIENIVFSNIVMDVHKAFHIWMGVENPSKLEGWLKNIRFENVTARITRGSYIAGTPEIPVRGVEFRNIKLIATGDKGTEFLEEVPYPQVVWGSWNTFGMPYGFYCRHAEGLVFSGVSVQWDEAGKNWSSALRCEDVEGLRISELEARQGPGSASPVVHLKNVKNAFISGCRAMPGSGAFLLLKGAESGSVAVCFNDLREAAKEIETGPEVRGGAASAYSNISSGTPGP